MKGNTKNIILKSGAEIIHLKGFNHTGIQEILNRAGVPKGSFYNYFKSKEDFGLQVIDFYIEQFSLLIKKFLEDDSLSPLEKIKGILDRFIEFFKSRDYAYGCPIGNLSQEMGDLSPAFRMKLKDAIDSMVEIYAALLAEAQKTGELSVDLDVRDAADFIVSSWQGALLRMKIQKGSEPLENHRKFIFSYILRP
ncbi:MAG: TetR family transcriptional regulator C-terminal domain-containing protein [Deltaproteobacteria bacterium]|nr:TetR family transcriptional regulator C-terminal domain-containing protein [Deltaproteobacteria bacterium]